MSNFGTIPLIKDSGYWFYSSCLLIPMCWSYFASPGVSTGLAVFLSSILVGTFLLMGVILEVYPE